MEQQGDPRRREEPAALKLDAPAKVNLYLEVRGRRPDGYHELVTVMQTVELCDEVELSLTDEPGVHLSVEGEAPADASNLAHRAAGALLAAAGAEVGVDLRLTKRIPAGGGLGGGSSDAAATLVGLQRLLGSDVDLHPLAAGLGADVPFFLHGGTALCTGRGERVEPIEPPQPFELELLVPPFAVSTRDVYAAFDGPREPAPGPPDVSRASVADLEALFRNDLETPARRVRPELDPLLRRDGVHLCGSGSTLFRYLGAPASAAPCEDPPICFLPTRSRNL